MSAVKTSKQRVRKRRSTLMLKASKPRRRKSARSKIVPDEGMETALKYLREGRSQKRAAEIGMISVARFRRFLREHKLAKRKGGRWVITDRRIREVQVFSEAGIRQIRVRGFGGASLAMRHRAAVQKFLDSNDLTILAPFDGQTVSDTSRLTHVLETRPNVLYRIANAGNDADMKIYRLID